MNDIKPVTKLEALPNEILIECFEYLHAIDIFSSFDSLNYRFYKLIRNIPLHLNAEHITKSVLIPFYIKILLNSQIKKQIISLKLSEKSTFDAIHTLLSLIPLNELSQLRSLTLVDLDTKTIDQISPMLPLLSNLRHFNFTVQSWGVGKILASLPTCAVQTLFVPNLEFDSTLTGQFTSLVNLMISKCSVKTWCHLFIYSPNLQYFRIKTIYRTVSWTIDRLRLMNTHAAHLKRLVINDFRAKFKYLEVLLEKTSNLKHFTISVTNDMEIIDACRWQNLITVSLPFLDIFKFKFTVEDEDDNEIFEKYQQFQSAFWHDQHHWYTELALGKHRACIYTVPYMPNEYQVDSNIKRYFNGLINKVNIFDNVTYLTLSIEAITDSCEYHFPNVKSLILENEHADENSAYPSLKEQHIGSLNMIVNLCNLTHLDISSKCRMKSPSTLLRLLQEAPHISSLKIDKNGLFPLLKNDELRKYFNKMIKKLDVTGSSFCSSPKSYELVELCQIFPSMQQFRCDVGPENSLELILDELSKLSSMKVFSYRSSDFTRRSLWWKDHASQLDLYSFTVECESDRDEDDDFSNDDSDSDS